MKINPKGVFFWLAMFCVAGCVTAHLPQGAYVFGFLGFMILIFG